ncbi:MAG TPA: hypothetical protein VKA46_24330 [Gemmataceae bacterium]|nr:hypothetical protein [Gemmataceae bacterium]
MVRQKKGQESKGFLAGHVEARTAQHFPVYPDDRSGPSRGQELMRVEKRSKKPPLDRVERQLSEYKHEENRK